MQPDFEYSHPKFKERRRFLRTNQTDAENLLWQKLRNKQIGNLRFLRQFSVGPYILDFFCPALRLGIELDGSQHQMNQEYDKARTAFLNSKDIKIIRFWNNDVCRNLESVLQAIHEVLPPLKVGGA